MTCGRDGCTGTIVDGYCDVCGMAARSSPRHPRPRSRSSAARPRRRHAGRSRAARLGWFAAASGRASSTCPTVPYRDPSSAIMQDPQVVEARRFCARCGEPVGRGARRRARALRRGSAPSAARRSPSPPSSQAGDVVAGQYEVVGLPRPRRPGLDLPGARPQRLRPLGGAQGPAQLRRRRRDWPPRSPSGGSWPRSSTRTSSRSTTSSSTSARATSSWSTSAARASRTSCGPRRGERRERPTPLPVDQALAYILEILPAFGYLHDSGLLFCDFKPDNVIQTRDSLKLIDLGGVYRRRRRREPDLRDGRLPGARGRRRRARRSPRTSTRSGARWRCCASTSAATRGRTQSTLPPPRHVPLFAEYDSLYRCCCKATAPDPDDRFQSADEMADQLLGVLREVVAAEDGHARARTELAVHRRPPGALDGPDWRAAARAAGRHRRPGGRLSRHRSPPPTPPSSPSSCARRPTAPSRSTCG